MLFTPFHRNTDEQHMASLSNLRFSVHLIGLSLFFVRFFPSLSSSLHHTFSVTAFLCLLLTKCFDCCHIALPLFSNIISSFFFCLKQSLCFHPTSSSLSWYSVHTNVRLCSYSLSSLSSLDLFTVRKPFVYTDFSSTKLHLLLFFLYPLTHLIVHAFVISF